MSFVSSRDIPEALAERLAKVEHSRACHVFDGQRGRCEPFKGDHRRRDLISAQIHLADLCEAFGWSVADLERHASVSGNGADS